MNFSELVEDIRALAAVLWPEDRSGRIRAKADRLHRVMRRRFDGLVRRRAAIETLRQRVDEHRKRIAGHESLDVEQAYAALFRDEARLQRREQEYRQRLVELEQFKRRLARLRARASPSRSEPRA